MRILHVVVNMNRGGAETLIMNLYRNIDRTKVQFDFLTCKEGVFDPEITQLGGKIHKIPYITEVGHFQYIQALTNFFTKNHYQIVHSHLDKMSGLVLRAAKKAGVPVRISHSHNTKSEGGIATKIYKWYSGKLIPSNATELFACSMDAAKWLFGKKSATATIIKNGIDLKQFQFSKEIRERMRAELGIGNETFVIGHIGRFNEQKNHIFLLKIFAKFVKFKPHSVLILVGDGNLKPFIEKKVRQMGLIANVRFLGVRSDVNRILQGMDVLVFPSLHEGLPVSLIEAQAAGIPCVISDVISDEVNMGAGLIHYESIKNSPKRWVQMIIQHSNTKVDPIKFIKERGYDITISASWIQEFYLKRVKKFRSSRETA